MSREKEVVKIYSRQYEKRGIGAQRWYPNTELLSFLGSHGFMGNPEGNRGKKILEVGCGSGANLWMLAKEGFDAYGVDGSEEAIKLADKHLREKWNVEANLSTGFFHELPYESETFDIVVDVVSLMCLDLEMSRRVLREITRVLADGGLFYSYRLSDRSAMYMNSGGQFVDSATVSDITRDGMPLAHNGAMSFWSPNRVMEEYGACGLCVESIERCTRTYQNGLLAVEYLSIAAKKG
ncbi:hypothetical protein TAMA11512_02930 [Selenomonas sp. TAMA-11512]|uniref:class I SAM-dependent methyltransferase n=1 Tax=Selenomonas sp. TAMA-11512 TaxID=3095337 RepID=UPI0030856337|nr:hypothetical protein TAMA11512_02930 [Selenomonas sp. TAMA-11512]